MAQILIGPLLRYVSHDSATIWVETDEPCEVRILDTTTSTFSVWGHHYALVVLRGSRSWPACIPYTVQPRRRAAVAGAGQLVPGERDPHARWRTSPIRVLFGSCRAAAPHEAPFDLEPADDERGIGVDALRAHGLRMLGQPIEEWPDLVMFLGDQVYADDPSPLTELVIDGDAATTTERRSRRPISSPTSRSTRCCTASRGRRRSSGGCCRWCRRR